MILNTRLHCISVWRPIGMVHDYDLLCCDFSTVQPSDLVAVDRVSDEYVGEVYMLKPGRKYEWYWIGNQRPDEATMFVSYDSHPGSEAPC